MHLSIPHAYDIGDGLHIEYESPEFPSLKQAQRHTGLEVLCFLVACAPGKVLMHPNQWRNHFTSIHEVRRLGNEVRLFVMSADTNVPVSDGSLSLAGSVSLASRITDMDPRPRPASRNEFAPGQPLSANFPQIVFATTRPFARAGCQ